MPLAVWGFSKMSNEGRHLKNSQSHKIRPKFKEHNVRINGLNKRGGELFVERFSQRLTKN